MRPTDFRNLNDLEENQSFQFSFNKNYLYCLLIFIFTINLTWRKGIGLQHGSSHCWLYEPLEKSILRNLEKQMLCTLHNIQVLFNLTPAFLFSHISYTCYTYTDPLLPTILINGSTPYLFLRAEISWSGKGTLNWVLKDGLDFSSQTLPVPEASWTLLVAWLSCPCASKPERTNVHPWDATPNSRHRLQITAFFLLTSNIFVIYCAYLLVYWLSSLLEWRQSFLMFLFTAIV